MPEASIAMTVRENFIEKINAMREAGGRFSKELDEIEERANAYGDRMDALAEQQASLQVQLVNAQKALAAAKKAYKEAGEGADPEDMKKAQTNYDNLRESLRYLQNASSTTRRGFTELREELEKIENAGPEAAEAVETSANSMMESLNRVENNLSSASPPGSAETVGGQTLAGSGSWLSKVAGSGILNMLGSAVSGAAGAYVGSAFDDETGSYVSGILGGVTSGAAMGALAGPWGALVGALAGGISGLVTSATEVFEKQDDAFKSYVQDQYDTLTGAMKETLEAGSTVAGSREQTRLAFAQRFGSAEAADDYLSRVQAFAGQTNYSYDEIVGYSKQLLNSYDPENVFDVLMTLSDASAGFNLGSSDVSTLINGLARMRTTGKATWEYLNPFQERGVDVREALSRFTGADTTEIDEMVSKGEIGGVDAAQAILDYIDREFGGLSDSLAGTYDAMMDNLEDAKTNLNAAMGEAYNQTRIQGIEAEQDFYSGASGQLMEDAYGMIGQWKASLENLKEEYNRDAMTAVMTGAFSENYVDDETGGLTDAGQRLMELSQTYRELQRQVEAGSEEAGAKMGALLAEAQAIAIDAYNASDGYKTELKSQMDLVENLRHDAGLQESYWNAGYELGLEFTKGLKAAQEENTYGIEVPGQTTPAATVPGPIEDTYNEPSWADTNEDLNPFSHADGIRRVPYDDYPAILHRDERILTAAEARSYDTGGGDITVTVTGNQFTVRSEEDIDAIAATIAGKIAEAMDLM